MRKLLLLGVALVSLGAAAPALAQSSQTGDAVAGATVGGATGGTIGFLLGGPVGAIVGGWAGAVIGGEAAVSDASIRYAGENPVDVVYLDSDLTVGAKVGDDVTIHPIEGDDQYGYIYANNRVYIIDLESHAVVQSPGYLIPNEAVSYVEANPTASISIDGDLGPGFTLDADVALNDIPDNRTYQYVYINDRPALVDSSTRTVVWVR
ncbi:MAG: DUF1236 domain-containing protein [Alphaproteobacteria bacterium]|nr:MAG: DUF1236 domain-containing protein [Alphaproteobacteria bacterium]